MKKGKKYVQEKDRKQSIQVSVRSEVIKAFGKEHLQDKLALDAENYFNTSVPC